MKKNGRFSVVRPLGYMVVVALFFGVGFLSVSYNVSRAQNLVLNAYGGVSTAIDCTCSGTFLVTVGPPRPAVVVYNPGVSREYEWYMIAVPAPKWALGLFIPGAGVCSQKPICEPIPNEGMISIDGTSLTL